jgi:histidine kinase/DNA gyrase B/HSP90-like ATPase
MGKKLNINVEQDHLMAQTSGSGITALSELIWNSLDADATRVKINLMKNALGNIYKITVEDNGHGLSYEDAEAVFQKLGGSIKSEDNFSPKGRRYHGKEGKGRFKALALGMYADFESIYIDNNGKHYRYKLSLNKAQLKNSVIGDKELLYNNGNKTGFLVSIDEIDQKKADEILSDNDYRSLHELFASYHISYPDFEVIINNNYLNFDNLIKTSKEYSTKQLDDNSKEYKFIVKIIEWNYENKKKTYLCNKDGIPYKNIPLGIRSSLPISIFIQSEYISTLKQKDLLKLSEMDKTLEKAINETKKIARKYVRERLHYYSGEFIETLKREELYPYEGDTDEEVERAKRQVFDIVALQVNEYLPSFGESDSNGKKFTLKLIKEALEKDPTTLSKILTEVVELPEEKKNDLMELLENTSLSRIIDTMSDINNKLKFITALELLIYDPDYSKKVLERKHLHKILVNETWIFGDEYTYGADDISLKNVLRTYLKHLGRDDFEEIVKSEDNSKLNKIPDVCLWRQFNTGKQDSYENMVIELKKPTVDAGIVEKGQIESYASLVCNDKRFPKNKTKWTFILITRDIKPELELFLNQTGREYGYIAETKHCTIIIKRWGDIVTEAKARYKFVKDKLDINLKNNKDAIDFLNSKYREYILYPNLRTVIC